MDNAVIVGWNDGYCATCGGFYLNLSNDTARNSNTRYALNYSDNLIPIINQYSTRYHKDHAPIYVSVSWTSISNEQPNWIRVTAIQSR